MHNGPSDKDYSLLSLLLKGEEKTVMSVCSRYLESTYGKHNVFCTQDFVYATGDIPILLVSHLDTVLYEPPKTLYTTKDRNVIMGKKGLGADDRAGVFAILKILKAGLRPSVLLTTGEEIGGLGAMSAFFLSYPLGWHLGATIIVVLGVIFLLAYTVSPKYGLLRKFRK